MTTPSGLQCEHINILMGEDLRIFFPQSYKRLKEDLVVSHEKPHDLLSSCMRRISDCNRNVFFV